MVASPLMKYLPVIWSGIWRKPGRTILIFLQVAVAFSLFGLLQGLKSGVEHVVEQARADILLVHGSLGLGDAIPLAGTEQIAEVPGVRAVIPVGLFMGTYQKPDQKIGLVAVRPDKDWLSAFTFTVAPAADADFRKIRTGALVKEQTARKYGWKKGDRIPLKTNVTQMSGSSDWTFDMVGTFTDADVGSPGDVIMMNYDFFDEARAQQKGTVAHFNVAIVDPHRAAAVSDEIDRRFANSANETRTDSLRELAQAELQSIGDMSFLIRAIVGAVLIALLFATSTMMMQSIRERGPELAVLKTLGFTDTAVFLFVLVEAVVIFEVAGAAGLAAAVAAFPLVAHFVPGLSLPAGVVAAGLAAAVGAAAISAAIPASLAARLPIVAALGNR
jgi:putative ABC transport system permease protein